MMIIQKTIRPMIAVGLLGRVGRLGLMGLVGLLGLVGCSEDKEEESGARQTVTIEAVGATSTLQEVTGGVTRGWNSDPYYQYSDSRMGGLFYNQRDLTDNSIDVYLTQGTTVYLHGALRKSGDKWKFSTEMEDFIRGKYYAYGYIPRDAADNTTITPSTTYANGAVLTIEGLKAITPSDVCVIVGAREGFQQGDTGDTDYTDYDGGYYIDSNGNNIYDEGEQNNLDDNIGAYNSSTHKRYNRLREGDFSFTIKNKAEGNYLFLLFDHIYSGLRFCFKVHSDYFAIRNIVLKKLELKADVKEKYDCTITLLHNDAGTSPISGNPVFTPSGDKMIAYTTIFNGASYPSPALGYPGGILLDDDTPSGFMGCFVPNTGSNVFTLRSTYDVYDKQGNLIRQNCTAENEINLETIFDNLQVLLVRGTYYTVNLTVAPTYLYVMSDPDLYPPTIKVTD